MMTFQNVPEAIPVGIAAALSGALAVFAWRRRAMPLAPAFAIMMASESAWALGAALEPIIAELPIKRLCIDLRALGTVTGVLGLLAFVLRYARLYRWLEPRRFGAICAPALPLIILAWTDPWHHLFWAGFSIVRIGSSLIAIRSYGPGFLAILAYCYALVAVSTALLAQAAMRFTGLYRAQAALMLFGVLLPWAVDIMDRRGLWGLIPVDLAPMTFAVTGLTFLPALLRLHLLDLPPVAWAVVVQLMQDAVVVIDMGGRIVDLNPAALRLLGRPAREILGVEAARAFGDWPALAGRLERIGERQEVSFEVDRPGPDPISAFNASISRFGDGEGPVGWVLVLRDITEHRRAERERASRLSEQAARAEAEAANRAKDQFLARVSHELRTPLTPALVTVTAMLDDPSTPAPLRPGLDMFRRNIALEAHLIDDLLDLTRIRRGEFSMRRETIDAHEQIDRALELCSDEAHNANVTLVAQLKAEAHHVDADPIRFQQVLWNLLKNAIKFSLPGGTVTIRSRNRAGAGREMGESWQVIEVIDRGIGIEPELLPRIFDLFVQGELAKGRRRGGLGLGLAISRMIVEQHGGRLVASSEGEGRGATFTLEFPTVATPLEASPARPPKPGVAIRHGPLKILLVEDNKDTLGALSAMLAKQGHDVRTAGTLADALRVVEECKLEMVISDIELPDGTGLDLMRELRGRGAVPGIAISGFGSSEDIKLSRSAGFAEHLTKPILFRQLEEAIQRVTADSQVERLTET